MKILAIALLLFIKNIQVPDAPEVFFKKGLENSQNGDYEQGIKDFSKAIALKNNYAEAYYNRGILFFEIKQPEKGFADFDKAIKIQPENGMFYFQRANRKWLMLDKEGACVDWLKSREHDFPLAEDIIKTKCAAVITPK